MIKVYNFNFGDYFQKIILDERKIIDTECTCAYGVRNKDMWKNPDKRLCKHIFSAILHLDLKIKKYGIILKPIDKK